MLHRFVKEANGHDPSVLRRLLGWLRRHHFEVLDLEELFLRLAGNGPPVRRAVAFTIDDGYLCQAEVAAPIFGECGAPVTTFLTTGFLDGALWLWWDQIEFVLQGTRENRVCFTAGARQLDLDLHSPDRRRIATKIVGEHCKALSAAERLATIADLAERVRVPIPETPPPQYRPMTWDQVRHCEARGMRFGPHTVTHPILARTEDGQARHEIEESWRRLNKEAARPVPIFGYPNGTHEDFGPREFAILRDLGFLGAVTAQPGYASSQGFAASDGAFQVPRFAFSRRHDDNLRYATHLEWWWQRMRPQVAE
jgi:peptidoglycan/xylan/chitin deacetylase (PgdA/CDA1 family)